MRDIATGLGVAALCLGFLVSATGIRSSETGLVGPAFVPMLAAGLGAGLGLLLALSGVLARTRGAAARARPPAWSVGEAARATLLVVLGGVFVFLFPRIGYEAAVFVFLILVLLAFGERRPARLLAVGVVGAIGFHLVFRSLMGVFMPTGSWFDVVALLGVMRWGS